MGPVSPKATIGSRVIVAASSANAGRMTTVLAKAEAAARIADGFAKAAKPGKYLVYLAGAREWKQWPAEIEGRWVAGVAIEETETVVINMPTVKPVDLDNTLRHELGHIASLAGRSRKVNDADSWWLDEGLAEYIGNPGVAFASYERRKETTAFVRTTWGGALRIGEPADNASVKDASGRYGTAFLAVTCLMKSY